jgi:isopenicillin-N N-acyltransferase-like protein
MLHQGVNGAGIGSVGNALYVPDAQPGVPKLVQYRRALTAETIEQAIRLVTGPERAFGNNHLLASSDGDIYDIEVTGKHWRMLDAGNTFLVHANHLIHPDLVHLDNDEDLLNSRLRQNRLTRLIQSSWGTITPESLRAMLADHANYPKSICKHSAPESDLDYGTIGSVVIDVTNRALWACAGNPCRSEWRELRV